MTKYFITCPDNWSTIDWDEALGTGEVEMGGHGVLYVGTDEAEWPSFWNELEGYHKIRSGVSNFGYDIVWIDEDDPRYDFISAFHLSCLHGKPELEFLRRAMEWKPERVASTFVRTT